MSDYTSKISDFMGSALAIVDVITDAVADNAKHAGSIVETEIAIKRLKAERAKTIYTLGEDTLKTQKVNEEKIEQIHFLDEQIAKLKASREAKKRNEEEEED